MQCSDPRLPVPVAVPVTVDGFGSVCGASSGIEKRHKFSVFFVCLVLFVNSS